eukprot:TRINITY_DN1745_c0_g1_i1.p1 TRINITY_DN1745_c0_g1~~TRINITY_DN1745_c0_g1_i1.p1  ORF type:complete len:455 (+),score=100.81 TRINITY_DN1745_c0_g1_i1:160-1524(+)
MASPGGFATGFTEEPYGPPGVPGMYGSTGDYSLDTAEDDHKKANSFIEYQKKDRKRQLGQRKLMVSTIFCFLFMCCEVVGGVMANSLAIMTDAAHLLSDLSAFSVSIWSMHLARRAKSKRMSFGTGRSEVLGMIVSILIIWVLTAWLLVEATDRVIIVVTGGKLIVNGRLMTIVASIGIVVNVCMFFILGHSHGDGGGDDDGGHAHSHSEPSGGHSHSHDEKPGGGHSHAASPSGGHSHSHGGGSSGGHGGHGGGDKGGHAHSHDEKIPLCTPEWFLSKVGGHSHGGEEGNVRAAIIHVIGDFIQSLGVLIAAIFVWIFPKMVILDPVCTFMFSILVLFTTTSTFKEGLYILLEAVPPRITEPEILAVIKKVKGVVDVTDMHCWYIAKDVPMFVAHVKPMRSITTADQCYQMVDSIRTALFEKYRFVHVTIEIDDEYLAKRQPCFFQFGKRSED